MNEPIDYGSQNMQDALRQVEAVINAGPYADTWQSLQEHQTPQWFMKAKFGIFIHWGVYSVPSFGSEWYPRLMYMPETREYKHHVDTYGPLSEFGYKDFIPMFTAEHFDADSWVQLFKRAGAQYIVPVAEHHDGFQMYASDISHWNAFEMGPHKDIVEALSKSCEKYGLTTGVSTHRIEHWFFMGEGKKINSDIHEPLHRGDLYWPAMPIPEDMHDIYGEPYPSDEFLQDWLLRTCELIDKYHPRVLYFDWWIIHSAAAQYLRKIAAFYYNRAEEWGNEVTICYKHDAMAFASATPDIERGQLAQAKPYYWQTDTAIARNSWCWTENNTFKPWQEIVQDLVDIVSKNGNLLLNVGPKPDGTISQEDRYVLEHIGSWLDVNGEAIYNAKPWRQFGEGPTEIVEGQFTDGVAKKFTCEDMRYTVANGSLYAIALAASENNTYCFHRLCEGDASHNADFHGNIAGVYVLTQAGAQSVRWDRNTNGLTTYCDEIDYKSNGPVVFKITLQ